MSTEIESVELAKGGQPYKDNSTGRATRPVEKTPTLADMGITKDESVVLNKGSMGIGKSAVVWADRTPTLADMSTENSLVIFTRAKPGVKSNSVDPHDRIPTLADMGITRGLKSCLNWTNKGVRL